MKPCLPIFIIIFVSLPTNNFAHEAKSPQVGKIPIPTIDVNFSLNLLKSNETLLKITKQLCLSCPLESLQFMFEHNFVRAKKGLQPFMWDPHLENYARWWAGKRKSDCKLQHSMPEDNFQIGECIFWGGGHAWTPQDAVTDWAAEEKYYSLKSNTCAEGQMCGHYTQIVWKTTTRIGCARMVCDNGDTFMTCNYYPPGNYVGEKPY